MQKKTLTVSVQEREQTGGEEAASIYSVLPLSG